MNDKPVSQLTFWKIVGLSALFYGGLFSFIMRVDGKLNAYKDDIFQNVADLNTKISTVETDVKWIKNLFEKEVEKINLVQ